MVGEPTKTLFLWAFGKSMANQTLYTMAESNRKISSTDTYTTLQYEFLHQSTSLVAIKSTTH